MTEQDLIGLNIVQMLDLIVAPDEPQRISMRPATDGWLWLGGAIVLLLAYFTNRWWVHRKANAYRQAALAELHHHGDDAAAIAAILRRTALAAYPRADVAGLQGEDWLQFLDHSFGRTAFVSETGRQMLVAPYRTRGTPIEGLAQLAEDWVRGHTLEARV